LSILPRTIEVHPGNEFVIHTKVKVGEGCFKEVKKAVTIEGEGQKPRTTIRALEKPHPDETPRHKLCRNTEMAVVTHPKLKDESELVTGKASKIDVFNNKGQKIGEKLVVLMENYELGSLEGMQSKLTDPQMIMVARDIAKGTAALHKNGIVHDDLKPANVLLKKMKDGTMKAGVADFGCAWFYGVNPARRKDLVNYSYVTGDRAFLPPEIHNKSGSGPETDIWAMGCTMYCMWKKVDSPPVFSLITGNFSSSKAKKMRTNIEREISKAEPGPRKEYMEIMLSALTLEQANRPSATAIQSKLDALIAKYPNFFKQ
jgi:serine/threonine protein kinase